MADHPPIGIDLGTTHSVIAVFDGDRGPRVLANELGRTLVPSVVALDDGGRLVVGHPALERVTSRPESAVARFKPDMGADVRHRLGDSTLTPVSLSALVLRELRQIAERALGLEVREVVVSVPAWFREPQRRATLDAARLAGLDVRRLVNEPTAAALAYGLGADEEPRTVAVLDLGGGTFDVTVMELFDGVVEVMASVGDVHLGGEDFTDALLQRVLSRAGAVPGDAAARGRLRLRSEIAKRQLSTGETATIDLTDLAGERMEVTRAELEEAARPLVERLRRCIREAAIQAGIQRGGVDEVVLVGGASRMPLVARTGEEVLGRAPRTADDLDHVVAEGAAVQAALLARHEALRERVVTDVLTHSLGVAILRSFGEQHFPDRFDPVLHRGTTLPVSRSVLYSTTRPDQEVVEIRVHEGEHRIASENALLATLKLEGLPVHTEPDRREDLSVRFTHDVSGLLAVEATIVSTGESARVVLERGGHTWSPEDRAAAEAVLDRLTTHPRDLLPNRWLLERATRVVSMLSGAPRTSLDEHLTAFEAALNDGDADRVAQWRASLGDHLAQVVRAYELDPEEA